MSLFKVCGWWNYQCPESSENYDSYSLTCCRLNADNEQQTDCIIVTSQTGYISILQPAMGENSESSQHTNIIYEAKLSEPILGCLCGNFVQNTQKSERQSDVIAILHPLKLVIYTIVTSEGIVEYGDQSRLQMLHENAFKKSAFTFCKGAFGGVKGKEFICVMFLDGSLKFFEQDGISQDCVLPGSRSIPSSFIYIPRTDCFILLAPNWDLECYRYANLSESFDRKFSPIWTVNVGEYILDLNSHQISNTESLIVLLGENNLMCVSDTGKIKFIKKLDYTPICFASFVVGWYWEPDTKLMIAVASESGSLLIYQHSMLVWCAELTEGIVSLKRANFAGLTGALVVLDAMGNVKVGFLGSEPYVFKVPPLNLSKLDYDKSKVELEEMEKEISASVDISDIPFINASTEKDLAVSSQLKFDDLTSGEFCIIHVNLQSSVNLEQIQILITTNPAFVIPKCTHFLKDITANAVHAIEIGVYASELEITELYLPALTIMISFINKQSIARVLKHTVAIPLNSVLKKHSPQKENVYKVTLSIAQPLVDFQQLFQDLNVGEFGQAVGFKIINSNHIVTIIVAKSSNRYRLQSNSLVALAFILTVLTQRLEAVDDNSNSNNKKTSPSAGKSVTVKSIPASTIEFMMSCLEKHYTMKTEMDSIITLLNAKTLEMRLFERCFLVKMQGKVSSSLAGIELLLKDTYNEIQTLATNYKAIKCNFTRVQIQLNSTIYFLRKVIEYADLPQKVGEHLLCITKPGIADWREQCWEETAAPHVDFLYNLYQTKANQSQIYENFVYKIDNFSLNRFKKQLKTILSVTMETGSLVESLKETEKLLNTPPMDDGGEGLAEQSEWNSDVMKYTYDDVKEE